MTKLLSLFRRHPDIDALSAHLDGRLDASAVRGMESHLSSCDACARRLAGLREARSAMRALASVDAPRSFRLRQADVEAAMRPAPDLARTPLVLRLMPATSAAATVLLAVLVGADLWSGGSSSFQEATGGAFAGQSAASKSANDAPAAPAARAAAGAGVTQTVESALDGSFAPTVATAQPPVAGLEPAPDGTGTGTNAGDASSTQARDVASATPPEEALTYRDARAPSSTDDGGWGALRIAEVIAGTVAAAAGAIALARRVVRSEVR